MISWLKNVYKYTIKYNKYILINNDSLLAKSVNPMWGPFGVNNLQPAVEEDDNDSGDH